MGTDKEKYKKLRGMGMSHGLAVASAGGGNNADSVPWAKIVDLSEQKREDNFVMRRSATDTAWAESLGFGTGDSALSLDPHVDFEGDDHAVATVNSSGMYNINLSVGLFKFNSGTLVNSLNIFCDQVPGNFIALTGMPGSSGVPEAIEAGNYQYTIDKIAFLGKGDQLLVNNSQNVESDDSNDFCQATLTMQRLLVV